jgi:penicillin amidase
MSYSRRVSRAKLLRRISLSVVIVVVIAMVVVTVVGVSLVRRPLPQTTGELSIPGLTSQVTVLRDAQGVPQIYASNAQDLFRAQGFVAAQDRFFQMDVNRHITAGRLSEMVGESAIESDRVIRTLGWRTTAEAELPTLSLATRQYLQAYADGVNAYISKAGSPDNMAVEYSVLGKSFPGYHVEPWTPVDSLSWLEAVAWDSRGGYEGELTRAQLSTTVTPARIAQIFPPYPTASHAPILSSLDWRPAASGPTPAVVPAAGTVVSPAGVTPNVFSVHTVASVKPVTMTTVLSEVATDLDQLPDVAGSPNSTGSDSFVVGPRRSSTGKPLLADAPQAAVSIPGVWYQTGLHCTTVSAACPFDVSGFSYAGMPGIVVGHNQSIAWGATNIGSDVSDFYLEQVRGQSYLRGNKYVPLIEHTETIKVAGGPDVPIVVRQTANGPLLSDVIPAVEQAGGTSMLQGENPNPSNAVALDWTGLSPGHTADSIFEMDAAQNFTQFRAAAKDFAAPSENFLYADTAGNIGSQASGQVPIRASATPGAPPGYWPAPGWDPKYDWTGFVPFSQMPTSYNPPEGYIVAANQPVSDSKSPFLTTEWDYGYRSDRIDNMITATAKVTPARMSTIQGDTYNAFAPALVKALLAVNLAGDPFAEEGKELLRSWDYTEPIGNSPTSAAAAFFNAVWSNILQLTFDSELGANKADGGSQWMQAVTVLLNRPYDSWWDNKLTPGVIESRDEILREAMVNARLDLTEKLGKTPVTWQWGRLHEVTLKSPILGGENEPGLVTAILNRGPWQMPGGSSIVNDNSWDASQGYQVTVAPSMRMIVNLGDLDASSWVNETGSSGHPYDAHYVDQSDAWAKNQTYPWLFSAQGVRAAGGDDLLLTPGTSGS